MFINIKLGRISKNDYVQHLPERQILDFALAEFSSAVEMLQAAKLVTNHKLKYGLIEHALDEYKHTDFFIFRSFKYHGIKSCLDSGASVHIKSYRPSLR